MKLASFQVQTPVGRFSRIGSVQGDGSIIRPQLGLCLAEGAGGGATAPPAGGSPGASGHEAFHRGGEHGTT